MQNFASFLVYLFDVLGFHSWFLRLVLLANHVGSLTNYCQVNPLFFYTLFFPPPYVYERGNASTGCRHGCRLGGRVLVQMNADLCKSGYRGAFRGVKGCIRASGVFFVLAAVSLPVPPLKADAPTLPNRFFLSSLDLAGFRHTCACELASIAGMPDPLD